MKRKTLVIFLIVLLAMTAVGMAVADTIDLNFEVTFDQESARNMLNMVNAFRTGNDAWYWSSDNKTKVTVAGLSPLTYDYELEKVAMQRAIEISIYYSHTRPDQTSCFTAVSGDYDMLGENIAAGYRTTKDAFAGWEEADENYAGQGHRRNMLNKYYNRIGIGHVIRDGVHYWTQMLGYSSASSTKATSAAKDTRKVSMSVDSGLVVDMDALLSPYEVTYGAPEKIPNQYRVWLDATWGVGVPTKAKQPLTWKSADETILKVQDGKGIPIKAGETTLTTNVLGQSISMWTVVQPADLSTGTLTLEQTNLVYQFGGVGPSVIVTWNGQTLTEDDYTVSYQNNLSVGEATVVVTGQGNYTNSLSGSFTIEPADINLATIEELGAQKYAGRAVEPREIVKMNGAQGAVAGLTRGYDYTVVYENNDRFGTAKMTLTGIGNYTGTKEVTFEIIPNVDNGWTQAANTWYYVRNGICQTGWQQINDIWYYFDEHGAMQTGFVRIGGVTYYMDASGAMQTGWIRVNNDWYYLNPNGAMVTGWVQEDEDWYYLDSDGGMSTGWTQIKGYWFYFNASGIMQTGWIGAGSDWYYLADSGVMVIGWLQEDDNWFYMLDSGVMVTGWQEIEGRWEYFDGSGIWQYTWDGN